MVRDLIRKHLEIRNVDFWGDKNVVREPLFFTIETGARRGYSVFFYQIDHSIRQKSNTFSVRPQIKVATQYFGAGGSS